MINFAGPPAAVSRAMSSINELVHNRLSMGGHPSQFGRGMGGRFPGRGPGGPPRGPGRYGDNFRAMPPRGNGFHYAYRSM